MPASVDSSIWKIEVKMTQQLCALVLSVFLVIVTADIHSDRQLVKGFNMRFPGIPVISY